MEEHATTHDGISVRPATRRELGAVADLYARAFRDDPVYLWLLPDAQVRAARLGTLFRVFVRQLHRDSGALDVAVRDRAIVGAALWDRPGLVDPGTVRTLRALPGMLAATRGRIGALAELGKTFEDARPELPHWYLFHLAADPAAQRAGIGSALLDHRLPQVDAADEGRGSAAYLECKPALVPYYGRFGFAEAGTISVGDGALTSVAMLRRTAYQQR